MRPVDLKFNQEAVAVKRGGFFAPKSAKATQYV
jgi:hypothetical protein